MKHKTALARGRTDTRAGRKEDRKKTVGTDDRRPMMRPDVDDFSGEAQSMQDAALLRSPKQENL